ncbi:MAG: lytic transglycosylase domain-containing protein [Shewanella sp. CG12_big_fil_rev_8_21_14_0_65_47_15]|nr:MAG: lytic transglycosylase domain-containing protein [Shewanella sp. CG12_big_fil_rev_8_21_14_0_65_47_15]
MHTRAPLTLPRQLGLSLWVILFLMMPSVYAEESVAKPKPRIVARYSDTGIASSEGQEKVKVYQYKQANGVTVFTDKAPSNSQYQILLFDCFACRPDSTIDWNRIRLFTQNYDALISNAAHKHQLEPALIRAVIHAESAFNAKALSRTGAMGLMQLMPETAKEMGVTNAFLPEENILGGSKYLAQMLKQFNGDIALACAAYNAGPTTVTQYKGVPPYPETLAYVERVQILLKRYRSTKV